MKLKKAFVPAFPVSDHVVLSAASDQSEIQDPAIQYQLDVLIYHPCTSSLYDPEDEAPEPITTVVSDMAPLIPLTAPRTIVFEADTSALDPIAVAFS